MSDPNYPDTDPDPNLNLDFYESLLDDFEREMEALLANEIDYLRITREVSA